MNAKSILIPLISFLLSVCLIPTIVSSVYASEIEASDNVSNLETTLSNSDATEINPPVSIPLSLDDSTLVGVEVYSSKAPVTSADSTGLKAILLSLIGDYDPIIVEYQYSSGNGYTSYLREVQIDYTWLSAAVVFALVLYCVLKAGGSLICKI